MYFVSMVLMLRFNLPEKYAGEIARSSLRRGLFEEWFDAVCFMVTGFTAVRLNICCAKLDLEIEK
jgi:Abscisic acid G-protein coupled receptor